MREPSQDLRHFRIPAAIEIGCQLRLWQRLFAAAFGRQHLGQHPMRLEPIRRAGDRHTQAMLGSCEIILPGMQRGLFHQLRGSAQR